MTGVPVGRWIIGLTAANAVACLGLWRVTTADPPDYAQGPILPMIAATTSWVMPAFERPVRQGNPAAARLFGSALERAPDEKPPGPTPLPEPTLRLVGIIVVDAGDGERVALLEQSPSGRVTRQRIGSELTALGWRVDRISSSSVDLSRGTQRLSLKLD